MKKIILALGIISTLAFADESAKPSVSSEGKLSHESEAGIILASGNSDTSTFSVKQATAYAWTGNTVKLTASFLKGSSSGVESAKKYDLGLRYERVISDALSGLVGYQLDSDPFSGVNLRHTFDLGGKYVILNETHSKLSAEAGYRLIAEQFTLNNGASSAGDQTSHMSRLYVEWQQILTPTISGKLWVEYLQSFTNTRDSRINLEPSLTVVLTEILSVKLAYLVNYRNLPAVPGKKQTDTLYTTSLVAKF